MPARLLQRCNGAAVSTSSCAVAVLRRTASLQERAGSNRNTCEERRFIPREEMICHFRHSSDLEKSHSIVAILKSPLSSPGARACRAPHTAHTHTRHSPFIALHTSKALRGIRRVSVQPTMLSQNDGQLQSVAHSSQTFLRPSAINMISWQLPEFSLASHRWE